jgi:valyl-tRNA synthetase
MALVQGVVGHARMLRQTYGLPPAQSVDITCVVTDDAAYRLLSDQFDAIGKIGKLKLTLAREPQPSTGMVASSVVSSHVAMSMPLGSLIDPKTEKARIAKDIAKVIKEIEVIEKKLGNADFVSRAPEDVIAENHARLAEEKARKQRLEDALALLEKGAAS